MWAPLFQQHMRIPLAAIPAFVPYEHMTAPLGAQYFVCRAYNDQGRRNYNEWLVLQFEQETGKIVKPKTRKYMIQCMQRKEVQDQLNQFRPLDKPEVGDTLYRLGGYHDLCKFLCLMCTCCPVIVAVMPCIWCYLNHDDS